MARIVSAAEAHIASHPETAPPKLPTEPSLYHAVALATVSLAETVGAEVIVAFSTSGNTAVRIARERPQISFIVLSPFMEVRRRLAILWGTQTAASTITEDFEAAIAEGVEEVKSRGIAPEGAHAVIVAGMPFGIAGTTAHAVIAVTAIAPAKPVRRRKLGENLMVGIHRSWECRRQARRQSDSCDGARP